MCSSGIISSKDGLTLWSREPQAIVMVDQHALRQTIEAQEKAQSSFFAIDLPDE